MIFGPGVSCTEKQRNQKGDKSGTHSRIERREKSIVVAFHSTFFANFFRAWGSNVEVPYRKLSDSIINFLEGVVEEEEEQERGTGWWMSGVIVKIAAPVMVALSDHLISA